MQQQDNTHIACRSNLQTQNIDNLEWLPYNPDLSPIKYFWDKIDKHICSHQQAPQNLKRPTDAIIEEWDRLPQHTREYVTQR